MVPKRTKFVNGKAEFYKVVILDDKILTGLYFPYEFKAGWNKPEGILDIRTEGSSYNTDEYTTINGGCIHVSTTLKKAKSHAFGEGSFARIIKVTCYEKDFIAENNGSEACFKKIWISKAMKDSAIKNKRIRVV